MVYRVRILRTVLFRNAQSPESIEQSIAKLLYLVRHSLQRIDVLPLLLGNSGNDRSVHDT